MELGDLIKALETVDPALAVPHGFGSPHSYRGFYDELAFEPVDNTTAGAMLEAARSAVGHTYGGWKGGEFTMKEWTDCWLAVEGCSGEMISAVMLQAMLTAGRWPALRGWLDSQISELLAEAETETLLTARNLRRDARLLAGVRDHMSALEAQVAASPEGSQS